ncbi:MAG: LysM peptidoglycan-binding domain-containing protein [Xanthomonadales bacterium]|nr:LysM peptidoglycan-binding domain-containing protein [Xanthomonadales bacterium]
MIRKFIYLILTTMLAGVVMAQDVSLRADHPDEYVVVRGDTLWDIAGKFLDHPWQWPAIWHANQQIQNPHLIYPGDRISLIYVDGDPRLVVDRGKPVHRMSPDIRSLERDAITTIPLSAIKPFIKNARILSAEEFEGLPYVVANQEQRINTTVKDRTYVRGLSGEVGSRYAIVRLGNIYYRADGEPKRAIDPGYKQHAPVDLEYPSGFWRPVNTWGQKNEIIGYELHEVSTATLLKNGDPAILEIDAGRTEVKAGDLVMELDNAAFPAQFMPRPMAGMPDDMKVLAVQGGKAGVGHYQIVAISGGSRQGLEPGHVFSAFRPGARIRDKIKYPAGSVADFGTLNDDKVTLPDEYDAHIMVIRVFDEVSYAMVMDGARPVQENDILKHADELL